MRSDGRDAKELRKTVIEINTNKHADGSCIISCGDTKIFCTATIEDTVPPFLRKSGLGWITAEYGMLPRSTGTRMRREASAGKQSGRTLEIQRLIGRALRTCIDRNILGERQILIDCDVLQADGGTRCASITGGWVALRLAMNDLIKNGRVLEDPILHQIAAVSCGIIDGLPMADLNYLEDSNADIDSNFVMNENSDFVEIQCSSERVALNKLQFEKLYEMAESGIQKLFEIQKESIKNAEIFG